MEVEAKAKEVSVLKLKKDMNEAERKADSSAGTWFVYILRCADDSLYTGTTDAIGTDGLYILPAVCYTAFGRFVD